MDTIPLTIQPDTLQVSYGLLLALDTNWQWIRVGDTVTKEDSQRLKKELEDTYATL